MLNKLYALYYYKRARYVRFLSNLPHLDATSTDKVLWSLYQLGLYSEVISQYGKSLCRSQKSLVAVISSSYALGQDDEASQLVLIYEQLYATEIAFLIEKITPFNYVAALKLSQKFNINGLLRVALVEKSENYDEAKKYLQLNLLSSNVDFWFLSANFESNNNNKILRVNESLRLLKLIPLSLMSDRSDNFSVQNLAVSFDNGLFVHTKSLVSILMTAFNAKKYIYSAISSILNQTYAHFELLIVDDCSTDGTWDIIQSFAKKDQRVRPMRQVLNAGTYLAKNKALLMAKGDFVMCHDADDWSHPQRLERQLQPLLEDKKLIATVSNWVRLTDQGRFVSRSVFPLSRLNPSSLLFRRTAVMKKVGFWDAVRTGADSEFNHRVKLAFGHHRVKKVNLPLSIGSFHEKSLMNAPETGFVDQRIPVDRQMYWESWMHWHINVVRNKGSFYLPIISSYAERKFEAPEKILPDESVLKEVALSIQH